MRLAGPAPMMAILEGGGHGLRVLWLTVLLPVQGLELLPLGWRMMLL